MAVKCGHCPNHHETTADVYRCMNGEEVKTIRVGISDLTPADRPTAKQTAFVLRLADERLTADEVTALRNDLGSGKFSRRTISGEIDRLKALPRRDPVGHYAPAATGPVVRHASGQETTEDGRTAADLDAGMYRMDGTIYKVQKAVHGSGYLYAKKLVKTEQTFDMQRGFKGKDGWAFEYAPGIIYKLRPEHRMTLEEAKEFGALYGTCCVCGRTLTRESSIEAGIGPVCAGKV